MAKGCLLKYVISGYLEFYRILVHYAYMSRFEGQHVFTYPSQPILWKRFIDDIFVIWHHGLTAVQLFINHLNTVHLTIKFTGEISSQQISTLDLIIYVKEDQLHTRCYTKPPDRHMYLKYLSEHSCNLKRSTLSSQFVRLRKFHSESQHLLEAQIHIYFTSYGRINHLK